MSSISSGELATHCRRRTHSVEKIRAMISGLLESVWVLTDTTGLPLVNPGSMAHVWVVQQKHLEWIEDPTGFTRCDYSGFLGWETVDDLAAYLVGMNRMITALATKEEGDIVCLYTALHPMDKAPTKYSQIARRKTVPGP
ncbi:hypothetical protein Q8A73_000005 [Channa argus]|nr:hypothetical protein Q8A73_000005 [Channa argus]